MTRADAAERLKFLHSEIYIHTIAYIVMVQAIAAGILFKSNITVDSLNYGIVKNLQLLINGSCPVIFTGSCSSKSTNFSLSL